MAFDNHRRTAKYTLVSVAATAADFSVFSSLVFFAFPFYAGSTFFGLLAGAIVSWTFNRAWVFSESTVELRIQRLRYFNATLLSFFLNMGLMTICIEWLEWPLFSSRVLTGLAAFAIGFWINSRFVFEVKKG